MSTMPGSGISGHEDSFIDPLIMQVEHAARTLHAYKFPLENLVQVITDVYEVADLPNAPPPLHSAYSSKPPEGRRQKFHSRNLPEDVPTKRIIPGTNAPVDYKPE